MGAPASHAQFVEPGTVVLHTFTGEFAGDQFGFVSEAVGDLNGDGAVEVAIGAPTYDGGGTNRGRIYVYNGATGLLAFPAMTGTFNNGQLGFSVGSMTDINGDGIGEIVAGAPGSGAGRAWIFSGADGAVLKVFVGQTPADTFGFAVRGLGDLNGDGIGDLLVGAPSNDAAGSQAGRAYVYSGGSGSVQLCLMSGDDANDFMGGSLDVVGDIDHDGVPDFVVGLETAAVGAAIGVGKAHVYSGAECLRQPIEPSPMFTLTPTPPAFQFAQFFVDGEGDVNCDGTADIYVTDFNVNKAYVFSGTDGSILSIYTGDGNGGFGIGRICGDVDDDGWDDLLLAAWISNAGASQAGKAFVYSGRTAGVLQTFTHTVAGAHLGFDANGMGDVNGDGMTDYLLTAADDSMSRGKAYLVAGNVVPFSRADIDLDSDVDADDVMALVSVLLDISANGVHMKRADVNRDGQRDGLDTAAYVSYAIAP